MGRQRTGRFRTISAGKLPSVPVIDRSSNTHNRTLDLLRCALAAQTRAVRRAAMIRDRALRCVPLGRKAWLFCGSDRGGDRAFLYTLIQTARLNDIDAQAWLADVLARIADHPAQRLVELLPWNWAPRLAALAA